MNTARRDYRGLSNMLVDEEGFTNVFDFGDSAFQVERFREDDFEDLKQGIRTSSREW